MAGRAAFSELTAAPATEFSLAGHDDDAELRALLRRSVIPGAVRVAFTREPDYFAGEGLAGNEDNTLLARRDGQLVGMGRCSVNTLHRNGTPRRIGYLGELRVDPGTPATPRMLRSGYEFLARHVTADGFFTSIATDNERARRVLERGTRLGLPAYEKLCDLVTLVAPVRASADARECDPASADDLTAFLQQQSVVTQLSLAWTPHQWLGLDRHGVDTRSFTVVSRMGRIVGAAAIWDQRSFRQTIIDGYTGALSLARPLLNGLRAMGDAARLPEPGSALAQGMLSGAGVRTPDDWPALWLALQGRAAAMGLDWLTIARDARDAELPVLRDLVRGREYHTTLYSVTWRDGRRWPDPWDARCFRPEVALL